MIKKILIIVLLFIGLKVSAQINITPQFKTNGNVSSLDSLGAFWVGQVGGLHWYPTISYVRSFYIPKVDSNSTPKSYITRNYFDHNKGSVFKSYVDSLNAAIYSQNHTYTGIDTHSNGMIVNHGTSAYSISANGDINTSANVNATGAIVGGNVASFNGMHIYSGTLTFNDASATTTWSINLNPFSFHISNPDGINGHQWDYTFNNTTGNWYTTNYLGVNKRTLTTDDLVSGGGTIPIKDSTSQIHDNLYYLTEKAVSRTNLSVYSRAQDDAFLAAKADTATTITTITAGDAKISTTATVTASSTTLTATGSPFATTDVGKTIGIPYAGNSRKTFITTIAAFVNSGQVTLTAAPINSVGATRTIVDGVMNNLSDTLTSATASWAAQDVGKQIRIPKVGPISFGSSFPDSSLTVRIFKVVSGTQVLVSKYAIRSVTTLKVIVPAATVIWGTDMTSTINTAIANNVGKKSRILFGKGGYLIKSHLNVISNIDVQGMGYGNTIIYPVGSGTSAIPFATFQAAFGKVPDSTVYNINFRNFELNGIGLTDSAYTSTSKGFNISPVTNMLIENIYVHNYPATGIGTDFLTNYNIVNNISNDNGRQYLEFGATAGGAGIGIGTSLLAYENGNTTGNTTNGNGSHGIFYEAQSTPKSRGMRVYDNTAMFNNISGIADLGQDGMVIDNNLMAYNTVGLSVGRPTPRSTFALNGQYTGNRIISNKAGAIMVSQAGGINFTDNTVTQDSTIASFSVGVKFTLMSTGTPKELRFSRNNISYYKDNFILSDTTGSLLFNTVEINNNIIYNGGQSTSVNSPGISIPSTHINKLSMVGNLVYDTRASASKRQSYGASFTSSTINEFNSFNNVYTSNKTGTTTGGTFTLIDALDVGVGGTGQTSYTNGQLLIGNTTGNTLTKATLTAGNGVGVTNSTGSITLAADTSIVTSKTFAARYATINGSPTFVTQAAADNSTKSATTAYVDRPLIDNVLSKTANYTIVSGDFAVGKKATLDLYIDATAGNVTITLPSAVTFKGYTIYVTKTDVGVNIVTINTVSGLNTLVSQYQERQFNSDGTNWYNH